MQFSLANNYFCYIIITKGEKLMKNILVLAGIINIWAPHEQEAARTFGAGMNNSGNATYFGHEQTSNSAAFLCVVDNIMSGNLSGNMALRRMEIRAENAETRAEKAETALEEAKKEIFQLKNRVQHLEFLLASERATNKLKISTLKEDHTREINNLSAQHTREINSLRDDFNQKFDAQTAEFKSTVNQINAILASRGTTNTSN